MSEQHPSNEFNQNNEHESASFEADFDISELLSADVHDALRKQVEESHTARENGRSEAAQLALNDVHSLYETTEEVQSERTVLVNGQTEKVIDAYVDARGNEWVELADGRQTMTHQEITPSPQAEQESVFEEAIEDKHLPAPDEALEAVEIHYQEILAEKNFDKESLGLASPESTELADELKVEEVEIEVETPEEITSPTENQAEQQEQVNSSKEELAKLYNQLRSSREEFARVQSREAGGLDAAINELATLKRRLKQTSNDGIDPILHGRVLQSIENARTATHQVFRNELEKRTLARKAESIVDRTLQLTESKRAGVRHGGNPLEASAKLLQVTMNRLNNADPRYYERRKSEFMSILERSLHELEEVGESNQTYRSLDSIVSTME